jgi:DNA topoisomerase-1
MDETMPDLSHSQFLKINKNYEKAAAMVNLVYVSDKEAGIVRIKKGPKLIYIFEDRPLKEKKKIERIKKLSIPPSWEEVWICPLENGHIQATGLDLRKRKQYRYHVLWNMLRNETKFHRLYEFGKALPQLRLVIEQDLTAKELTKEKVLATVLSLMERTYIRIGNTEYEKLYGSYGLTTMKDKHAAIEKDKITFTFRGKKGVYHKISLKNKKLSKVVKDCRDIPGRELFQYYDAEGNRRSVDSGMVNHYIQASTGQGFTAKDFRTWAGSLQALQSFRAVGEAITEAETKKNIVTVLEEVSKKLGNTRSICKKYYVHPGLIRMYEEKKLARYLHELDEIENPDDTAGLTAEEQVLMKILKA